MPTVHRSRYSVRVHARPPALGVPRYDVRCCIIFKSLFSSKEFHIMIDFPQGLFDRRNCSAVSGLDPLFTEFKLQGFLSMFMKFLLILFPVS